MAFRVTDAVLGLQPIAETSTTQRHPVGKIVRAADPTLGEGEFIYLKGVASTAVGLVVSYNTSSFTTTLGAIARNLPNPVAVAMSANVASQWGWYQIGGIATAAKSTATSLAEAAAIGLLTAATGLVVASATDREVQGAFVAAVASAVSGTTTDTILICINRPRMQGRLA